MCLVCFFVCTTHCWRPKCSTHYPPRPLPTHGGGPNVYLCLCAVDVWACLLGCVWRCVRGVCGYVCELMSGCCLFLLLLGLGFGLGSLGGGLGFLLRPLERQVLAYTTTQQPGTTVSSGYIIDTIYTCMLGRKYCLRVLIDGLDPSALPACLICVCVTECALDDACGLVAFPCQHA